MMSKARRPVYAALLETHYTLEAALVCKHAMLLLCGIAKLDACTSIT